MPSAHERDARLVQNALAGKEAFRSIVEHYHRAVFHRAYLILRDHHLAEDATQETFCKAYQALDRYDPQYALATWLFTIATNTAITMTKKQGSTTVALDTVPEIQEVSTTPDTTAREQQLQDAVGSLKPSHRTAFVLYHYEQHSYDQIAEAMGVSLAAVKSYIFRARKTLWHQLKEGGAI